MNISCIVSGPMQSHKLKSEDPARGMSTMWLDGYRHYLTSPLSLFELTTATIRECVERARIARECIDAVILVTESFHCDPVELSGSAKGPVFGLRDGMVATILAELPRAFIYGNWLSGCANLVSSLSLAKALITGGQHSCVVLLLVDRLKAQANRVVGSSLLSDIGAACLISAGGDWEMEHIFVKMSEQVMRARLAKNTLLQGRWLGQGLREAAAGFRAHTGHDPGSADKLIADNLHSAFLAMAAEALGVAPTRLETPSKPLVGHCFSADCLLSLREVEPLGTAALRVLLVNLSPWSFGLALLRWQGGGQASIPRVSSSQ